MSDAKTREEAAEDKDVFAEQLLCDINFLESRLAMMRGQMNPNEQVIRIYDDMLTSRIEVLKRLKIERERSPMTNQNVG